MFRCDQAVREVADHRTLLEQFRGLETDCLLRLLKSPRNRCAYWPLAAYLPHIRELEQLVDFLPCETRANGCPADKSNKCPQP